MTHKVSQLKTSLPVGEEKKLSFKKQIETEKELPIVSRLKKIPGIDIFILPGLIPDLIYILEKKGEDFLKGLISNPKYIENPYDLLFDKALQDDNIKRYETEIYLRTTKPQTISSTERCRKCKQQTVTSFQAQVKASDEALTTFYGCTNCEHKWKV